MHRAWELNDLYFLILFIFIYLKGRTIQRTREQGGERGSEEKRERGRRKEGARQKEGEGEKEGGRGRERLKLIFDFAGSFPNKQDGARLKSGPQNSI